MRILFESGEETDPYAGVWTLLLPTAPATAHHPEVVLQLDQGPGNRVALTFPSTLLPALRRLLGRVE